MAMTLPLRRLALTAHVTSSVGWLGAVGCFLALAIAGLTGEDAEMVRAAYLAMNVTGWFVIVPLSLASLPTGLVMSFGTEWGLFRHYWVLAKVLISVPATILLLVHMQPVGHLARVVSAATLASGELAGLRVQLTADAGAALIALLVATALSVYKPRGLTPYGKRKQNELRQASRPMTSGSLTMDAGPDRTSAARARNWALVLGAIGIVLVVLFVFRHVVGGGMSGH